MFCAESKDYFAKVCQALDKLNIPHEIAPRLVRGLDYYIHTVFEVEVSIPATEGQDAVTFAVAGGGRYQLVPPGSNKPIEGIGFAAGMERLLMARAASGFSAEARAEADIMIAALGENAVPAGLKLAQELRTALGNLRVKADFSSRSLKAQMRTANRLGARTVLILGDNEIANAAVVCRDMSDSSQTEIPMAELVATLQSRLNAHGN